MMATLPQLYAFHYDGKNDSNNYCYINTTKIGLFNATMKYIFGENYAEQGIEIFCYQNNTNPYLVIRSEGLLNYALEKNRITLYD